VTLGAPLRVLITDAFEASGCDALRALGCELLEQSGLEADALAEAVERIDPHVIIVRSTRLAAALFERARSLSLVVRAGAGYDNIDVAAASERGVFVANCPGKNAIAVAELAFGLLIAADRQIAAQSADLVAGRWKKREYASAAGLFGRTLGIVGMGPIGRELAQRARAFGMQTLAWSRSLTEELAAELGVERAPTLLDLAARADAVSIHVAAAPETERLIGEEFFAAMKPGAIFVNTARASIVDAVSLANAVREKSLKLGLDVWPVQPKSGETSFADPLIREPGVVGTHHNGASTEQAQQAIAAETVRVVRQYAETGAVLHCVNRAATSPGQSLLTVRHLNLPGVLAAIFDVIDGAQINVEEMENIVYLGARAACARIFLDAALSDEALDFVRGHEHVLGATQVPIAR
jgi:D-3-phosphoglycerate dehydrogenase / 2-oxoglutarate reductase